MVGLGIPIALVLIGSLRSLDSDALPVTSFLGLLKLPLRLPYPKSRVSISVTPARSPSPPKLSLGGCIPAPIFLKGSSIPLKSLPPP